MIRHIKTRLDLKTALRGFYRLTVASWLFRYLDRIVYRHFIQLKNIIFVQNVNRQMRRFGVFYGYKLKQRTVYYNERYEKARLLHWLDVRRRQRNKKPPHLLQWHWHRNWQFHLWWQSSWKHQAPRFENDHHWQEK